MINKKEYEINFGDLIKGFWRKKWFIVGVSLLMSAGMYFFAVQKEQVSYTAVTEVAIVPENGVGQENPMQYLQMADLALVDYKVLLKSDSLAEFVANNVSELPKSAVRSAIEVEVESSSRILGIKITSTTPENVIKIRDMVMQRINPEIESMYAIKEVKILNHGEITRVSDSKGVKYALMGLFIGASGTMLCVLIYLLAVNIKRIRE